MKRRTRVALSAFVLLVSPMLAVLSGVLVLNMIPGVEVTPGFIEATPVNLAGGMGAFIVVTGLSTLAGWRFIWDRRFD